MNDKQQLAAMGEHMAEHAGQAQPMCMAKRIEELEGLLTEAAQYIHDYCEVTSSQGYSRGIRLLNYIRQQVYAPKPDAKP